MLLGSMQKDIKAESCSSEVAWFFWAEDNWTLLLCPDQLTSAKDTVSFGSLFVNQVCQAWE